MALLGCFFPVLRAFRARRVLPPVLFLVFLWTPVLTTVALSGELLFTPPAFLNGDDLIGAPAGQQVEADLALGGSVFLAVWSDGRTTPDDHWPFATEGSGTDIYGALLDASGNLIGAGSFVVNQDPGDQVEPRVAWNGENWLVVWKQATVSLPTYEEVRAVRVAPDGTVLDDPPVVVLNNEAYYSTPVVEAGAGEWLVLSQADGPFQALLGVRVAADGTVMNPGGLRIHNTSSLLDFDAAFAGDEYLIVWQSPFDGPRGRRYTPDLVQIGTTPLPFAQKVATDGVNFLITHASGPPPLATIDALVVTHAGAASSPFNIFTGGNQDGTCCVDATWDGSYYWVSWGGTKLSRVTAAGGVLDPGGFTITPIAQSSQPRFAPRPAGGLELVYNDGVNGSNYPKDVYAARVPSADEFENEILVSRGAPAQLWADFAEGAGINLVTFQSRVSGSARILAQRIDDDGVALDAEPFEVASGPIPGEGLPSLGAPGVAWNGSLFMITWSDGLQIFARRMLSDGTFVDATPLTVMDGRDPDVAAVGGVFLVVGLDFLNGNPHWQATHSMRVDGATGLNLDPEPNALGGFVIFARYPHVVSWGERWLVVWQRNLSHDNIIAGTAAAIVDADGTTPGLIDVPLGWRPEVAVSDDVALFVAVTGTIASATTDLAGIIMTADGTLPGTTFLISSASDKQLLPAASWNGAEFIVTWEDKRNSVIYFDERTDIYGSRVVGDGTVLDPAGVPVASLAVPEIKPTLLSIGSKTLLGVSTFRSESDLGAFRVGIQVAGGSTTGVDDVDLLSSQGVRLLGARPNPAQDAVSIRFDYRVSHPLGLQVYDAHGRRVRTLLEGETFPDGGSPIEVIWDGRDDAGLRVGSGVYFLELRSPLGVATEKVVRLP